MKQKGCHDRWQWFIGLNNISRIISSRSRGDTKQREKKKEKSPFFVLFLPRKLNKNWVDGIKTSLCNTPKQEEQHVPFDFSEYIQFHSHPLLHNDPKRVSRRRKNHTEWNIPLISWKNYLPCYLTYTIVYNRYQ